MQTIIVILAVSLVPCIVVFSVVIIAKNEIIEDLSRRLSDQINYKEKYLSELLDLENLIKISGYEIKQIDTPVMEKKRVLVKKCK